MHAGYPVVDIRVTLLSSKPPASTLSGSFQNGRRARIAGGHGRDESDLAEPIDEISVLVPDISSAVLGDLSSRRGQIARAPRQGHDRTLIRPRYRSSPLRNRFALAGAWGRILHPVRLPATNRCPSAAARVRPGPIATQIAEPFGDSAAERTTGVRQPAGLLEEAGISKGRGVPRRTEIAPRESAGPGFHEASTAATASP